MVHPRNHKWLITRPKYGQIPVITGVILHTGMSHQVASVNFTKLWNIVTGWWYTYTSEKYEFVSWDDDIPNMWKNKTCSKPPTNNIGSGCKHPSYGKKCQWVAAIQLSNFTTQVAILAQLYCISGKVPSLLALHTFWNACIEIDAHHHCTSCCGSWKSMKIIHCTWKLVNHQPKLGGSSTAHGNRASLNLKDNDFRLVGKTNPDVDGAKKHSSASTQAL